MSVLLRVNEVAEVLACHPITVRRLIKRGLLRPVYVGRALRVSDDEVLRYLHTGGQWGKKKGWALNRTLTRLGDGLMSSTKAHVTHPGGPPPVRTWDEGNPEPN